MVLPEKVAFFLIHVKLTGSAAVGKPEAEANYKVVAYIPTYTGKLTGMISLPYREKIVGHLTSGMQTINWGKNPSLLPNETASPQNAPKSPFPAGVDFRFLIDDALVKKDPATATLVGFGQVVDPGNAVNMCVYHVAKKDQKIISFADTFDVYVHYVVTNGNLPQSWAK